MPYDYDSVQIEMWRGDLVDATRVWPEYPVYIKISQGCTIQDTSNLYGFPPAGQNFSIEYDYYVTKCVHENTRWDIEFLFEGSELCSLAHLFSYFYIHFRYWHFHFLYLLFLPIRFQFLSLSVYHYFPFLPFAAQLYFMFFALDPPSSRSYTKFLFALIYPYRNRRQTRTKHFSGHCNCRVGPHRLRHRLWTG